MRLLSSVMTVETMESGEKKKAGPKPGWRLAFFMALAKIVTNPGRLCQGVLTQASEYVSISGVIWKS
jgi:hypothetical protein